MSIFSHLANHLLRELGEHAYKTYEENEWRTHGKLSYDEEAAFNEMKRYASNDIPIPCKLSQKYPQLAIQILKQYGRREEAFRIDFQYQEHLIQKKIAQEQEEEKQQMEIGIKLLIILSIAVGILLLIIFVL